MPANRHPACCAKVRFCSTARTLEVVAAPVNSKTQMAEVDGAALLGREVKCGVDSGLF